MEYNDAQRLLKHALDNQKTIQVDKLKELLQTMNIDLDKPTDENELQFLRKKVRVLNRHMLNLERDKNVEIGKLKDHIRIQEAQAGVEILKAKNGIASVILFQGHRYIRDMQNKLHTHKYKNK